MRTCKLFILFILLFGCGDKEPESGSVDVDRDGVVVPEDCNDTDASMPIYDQDCDGILTEDDCDDNDNTDATLSGDCDADGVLTADDCDDSDASSTVVATDSDCDGVPNFYLASNGVTVMCPTAAVEDTGIVNGITYTKRDRADIDSLVTAQNVFVWTG